MEPFRGNETIGNAFFDRSAHANGSEMVEIEELDVSTRARIFRCGHCQDNVNLNGLKTGTCQEIEN